MKNKDNSTLHIILFTLASSLVVTYITGVKYKDFLLKELSDAIYYQLLTFISLLQPLIITYLYKTVRKVIFNMKVWHFKKFKKNKVDINKLPADKKEAYEAIISGHAGLERIIGGLDAERQRLFGDE